MNNSEFMDLMNELGIPEENIITRHEPQDSLKELQEFEKQYNIDTSDVISQNISVSMLPISKLVYEKWLDAFDTFTEYCGDSSLINMHKNQYVQPSDNSQEAEFVNPASFFVQRCG
ncbi:hypothetical protein AZI11_08445 [Levilactobacillus brevis]|uniref:hypothetical protein n=1 Tax=Levilactobacillus brevis TaxID=1580 RepID=UPI000A209A7A|nr:hypothetical protein [Levilactobacillus brevis]ARN92929.1 hypothetical protein AZI11_08445 [Levilactobacillus brevis]ARN95573.1 hypothetical protein AZI12_08495 [Levilactobacillus brevis]MBS0978719.1 hypothetical protein [Levilactobacillus brevis]